MKTTKSLVRSEFVQLNRFDKINCLIVPLKQFIGSVLRVLFAERVNMFSYI